MHDDEHHQGLAHDLMTMAARITDRRQVLRLLAGASLIPVIGCGGSGDNSAAVDSGSGGGNAHAGSGGGDNADAGSTDCSTIPEETAGPYPGDGSNGPNALALTDVVRSDIRSSIGGATGTAEGIPLTVVLTLVNSAASCASLAGYAIYLWHCDRDGNYSMYSAAVVDENYLRGVQETDSDGTVTFTTIFPGCYAGRMPHMHFEVYPSLELATTAANKVSTSQLALPEDVCDEVYATTGYEDSVRNFSQISFESDNVFSDGVSLQLASVTGSVADGYEATLSVAISE